MKVHCIEVEKHDLNKRQTSVKLYISLTLVHSAMYTLLHSHVKQFLSLLPKANSSEITVLLLTPQHSSTNPKAKEVGAHALLNGVLQSVRGH